MAAPAVGIVDGRFARGSRKELLGSSGAGSGGGEAGKMECIHLSKVTIEKKSHLVSSDVESKAVAPSVDTIVESHCHAWRRDLK